MYLAVAYHAVLSLMRIIGTSAPDFSVLYQSAINLRLGASIYQDASLYTGLGYPAVSLLPFLPFTFLPYFWAQALWILGSFAAFCGVGYLSLRMAGRYTFRTWCTVMTLGFLAFPTKFTFGMGQANYYALYFLLLGISTFSLSGFVRIAVLILALLLKPHFLFVYGGLLLTYLRPQVVKSLVVAILAIGLLGYITGWSNEVVYLHHTVPQLMRFDGRELYYNQGIQAGIARLMGNMGKPWAMVISVFIAIISYASIWVRKNASPSYVLALLLPMQVLIEPLAWQHHLIFLLPTFVLLWPSSRVLFLLGYVLVAWNIKNPVYWQGSPVEQIIMSHALAGLALIWYMVLVYL